MNPSFVIPAKAGIQLSFKGCCKKGSWAPAFAGVTAVAPS
jgi:hypothetical protein